MKKNIAILFGGDSSESEVSLNSGKQVFRIVDKEKYNPFLIFVKGHDWTVTNEPYNTIKVNKDDFSILFNNEKIRFDFALIAIHGTPGENGVLQGYFDIIGIPYSTSDLLSSAITFNKYACKLYLKDINIDTAKAMLLRKRDKIEPEKIVKKLQLPCFVKPNNGGSSYGASKVKEIGELKTAVETAFKEDSEVIIEEYIKGTEITCGVFKRKNREIIFPITEIVSKNDFFDVEAKYKQGRSDEITPARISKEAETKCREWTSKIYDALNCKGICRVDFILTENRMVFLEINTVPGMTEMSIIPQQAAKIGISMTELFTMVIEDCISS
ncbi:MAG: D-alanine--D-alanine ligase [Bacteroidia bacterium]|nr:D-alanine--D-alanine ligase [Bacteroidia bacterium]